MAVETELKLRIAPEQLARFKRHPLLKAQQRPSPRRLYNIYFDTPKLELELKSGGPLQLFGLALLAECNNGARRAAAAVVALCNLGAR